MATGRELGDAPAASTDLSGRAWRPILVARGLALAASVGSVLIMSGVLGPAARGEVAIYAVVQLVISVVAAFGTNPGAYVASAHGRLGAPRLVGAVLGWGGLMAIATFLVGVAASQIPWLTAVDPRLVPLLAAGAAGQYLAGTITQIGMGLGRRWLVAIGFAGAPLALFGGTLVAAAGGGGALRFIAAQALAWVIAAIALGVILGVRPTLELAAMRALASIGRPAWIGEVANVLSYRLDTLILAAIAGTSAVGIYSLAVQVLEPLWIVATSLASGLLLGYREAAPGAWRAATGRAARVVVAWTVLGVAAAVVAFPIVVALVGEAFAPSRLAAAAIGPGIVALALGKVLAAYQVGLGRLWLSSVVATTSLVVTTLGDLVLIPTLGATGAALASSVGYGLAAILWLGAFRRFRGPRDDRGHVVAEATS